MNFKIGGVIVIGIKGATAYELQIGKFGVRIVHFALTKKGYFAWYKPLNRLSFHKWDE